MATYTPTIGLEIHAELNTRTKMFCNSPNNPDATEPNVNICPICLAHPGTLPTVNKEAVRQVLRVGTALNGTLADYTEFDRKNYFYPDLPKGYQISQYEFPLVSGGELNGLPITRVHLEEDTARSEHAAGTEYSLVNFNRAGVPLMELVTEPALHDATSAAAFGRELRRLLRALGASSANMEKGEMRVEANISISDGDTLGTKVEVKNLNSLRAVEQAIYFEIERQTGVLERGELVVQETRGWDENKRETFSQRLKESSEEYRYFPDPDIPKFHLREIAEFSPEIIADSLPELPTARRTRYTEKYRLSQTIADQFIDTPELAELFDAVVVLTDSSAIVTRAANYISSDITGILATEPDAQLEKVTPEHLISLMKMLGDNQVSSRGGKDVLRKMALSGGHPKQIAQSENLFQESDDALLAAVAEAVVSSHADVAAEIKEGKTAALQFLVGQGMKETHGRAHPDKLRAAIEKVIGI